jgi:hypothetical protein
MRLPFFDPRRDEVVAIATDLITRFGLRACEEASHLAELSLQMGSRRKRALYESVAREIDASFLEAQRQRDLRQSASDVARLGRPVAEGHGAVPGTRATAENPMGKRTILAELVAELNRVDPSPRRATGSLRTGLGARKAASPSGEHITRRGRPDPSWSHPRAIPEFLSQSIYSVHGE